LDGLFARRGTGLISRIIQCLLRSLPTNTILERLFEELVDQLGHGQLLMLGFVVKGGDNEEPDFGSVMLRSGHGGFCVFELEEFIPGMGREKMEANFLLTFL